MNHLEFSETGFRDFPERGGRRGGGIFSRVFPFLASVALCLSFLAAFTEDAFAITLTASTTGCQWYSNNCVRLTWSSPGDQIASIEIQREENGIAGSFVSKGSQTFWEENYSSLPDNTKFRFRVKFLLYNGQTPVSDWSNEIVKGTPPPPPSQSCASQSQSSVSDCAVLEAFYDSAGGANWSNSTNWKTANSLATWHGVKVRDGRVYEIELYDNGLTGTISDLSALTGLTYLDLGNDDPRGTGATNSLSGTIPDLSALTSLRYLLLDGNSLSGTIPDLRNTNVRVLQLNNNNISGEIPTWLNDMDLRELYLHDNQLSGTIPDLSDVDDYDLDLSNNNLSGTIPAATHFPEEMRNFQGRLPAGKLNLSNNNLSGAIPDLSSLNNLYAIDLSNNSLNGSITAVLFPVGLNILDLSDNELSGAIPDLSTRMTKLTYLYLQNNQFSGTIPDLSSVGRQVWLNGNSISGTINADDFDNGVSYLYLHKNQLSNSTTIDLSSLSNLSEISLWGNPGLDLTRITGLDLSLEKAALWILYDSTGGSGWTNSSGWPVGSNFSQGYGITTDSSGNVTGIDLSENNLTGKINGGIAVLDSLEGLDLSCNSSLSGELPLGLKYISTLATVNICSTGMTVPSDQSFTTWKDGITFTDGTCSGAQACQAPVSNQGSSPPVSQSPDEGVGAGQGEGEPEDVQSPVPDPELPAADPGNIEAGGGCALVSGTGEERPGAAASGLLLAAFVLLPAFTGRHGRRAEGR